MRFAIKVTAFVFGLMLLFCALLLFFVYPVVASALQAQLQSQLESQATYAMRQLDSVVFERSGKLQAIASDPIISSRNSTPEQVRQRLIEFRNSSHYLISISFLGMNRTRIADTSDISIGMQDQSSDWWTTAGENGKISIAEDVHQTAYGLDRMEVIYFAVPVKDSDNKQFGVIVTRMPLARLTDIVLGNKSGGNILVDLIDSKGRLLYSGDQHKILLEVDALHNNLVQKAMGEEELSTSILEVDPESKKPSVYVMAREPGYLTFGGNGWVLLMHAPEEIIFAPVTELRNQIFALLLFMLAAYGLVTFYFIGWLSTPIRELRNAAVQLGKVDFATHTFSQSGDEFDDLGSEFNRSAEALKRIDDEKKQADRAKTQFLTITSHELRSPMTPMKAQLQMLKGEYFGHLTEKQKQSLDIIVRNADRLDKILVDFLEISRIEAARLNFSFAPMSPNKLLDEVAEYMRGYIPKKKILLVVRAKKLPIIKADADRTAQVLRNLISNAIKFSHERGVVEIGAEKKDAGMTHFWVKDSGVGISPANQRKLFEPFYQVDKTFSRQQGGTGLGLAICKGIVQAQGGKIWVESAVGRGSTFHFTVPDKSGRSAKSIKVLFSPRADVEEKMTRVFAEFLGPMGESELEKLKENGKFDEQSLLGYADSLVDDQVLEKETAIALKDGITAIFKGEKA